MKPTHFIIFVTLIILFGIFKYKARKNLDAGQPGINIHSTLSDSQKAQLHLLNIDHVTQSAYYAFGGQLNAQPHPVESCSSSHVHVVGQAFPRMGFYLYLNEKEVVELDSNVMGMKLYIVNTTDSEINLNTRDDQLFLYAEALDAHDKWRPISQMQTIGAGAGSHSIVLGSNEYLQFGVPMFTGIRSARMRYTIWLNEDLKFSSNEIDTYINPGQFEIE